MKPRSTMWVIIFALAAAWLAYRALTSGMGQSHVRVERREFIRLADVPETDRDGKPTGSIIEKWVPATSPQAAEAPNGPRIAWNESIATDQKEFVEAERDNPGQTAIQFSWPRTLGIWIASLLTLCILSFLLGDNVFYKIAESVVVGASAAYVMVAGFWSTIVGNLLGKLIPDRVRDWAVPGMSKPEDIDWWRDEGMWYVVPLILSIMLLWRLAPVAPWIARWPLAFFIGATAGFRLIGFLGADFLSQIGNTILPLFVTTPAGDFDFWPTLKNVVIVLGVLTCLVYFFFSIEHKGVVAGVAKVGIGFLMITFGAGFGYTVMGRIALLAERLQFLFDDWLWLIDPLGRRALGG